MKRYMAILIAITLLISSCATQQHHACVTVTVPDDSPLPELTKEKNKALREHDLETYKTLGAREKIIKADRAQLRKLLNSVACKKD